MKTKLLFICMALGLCSSALVSASPLDTTFTYQGQLTDGGQPANGSYDLQFTLYDTAGNGSVVAGPVIYASVSVSNGLFTTALDFEVGVFTGDARWLELGVRTNGSLSDFTPLTPRQPLTPVPYALHAPSAGWAAGATIANGVVAGAIGTTHLQNGSVGVDQLAVAAVETAALADNAVTAAKLAKQLSATYRLMVTNPISGTEGGLGFSLLSSGGGLTAAGAPFEPDPTAVGIAYLGPNIDGSWGGTLTNPYPASGDRFGHAVASAGEVVIISAPGDNAGAGAVHVYNLGAQEWEEHFLNPTANPSGDEFGHSLCLLDGLAVGAPFDSDNVQGASYAGAVHVFPYQGGTQRTVTSPQPAVNGNFGYALAGLRAGPNPLWIVGEPFLNDASRSGAIHLYQAEAWTWLRSVTNPVVRSGDQFGYAVAAWGNDKFIVGAPRGGSLGNGNVCVFRSDGTLVISVESDNPEIAGFGSAVTAVGTDWFAVGAPEAHGMSGSEVGCVLIYRLNGALVATLENPSRDEPTAGNEHFGHALAWSSGHLYVGAPGDNDGDGAIHDYSLVEWVPGIAVGSVLDRAITSSMLGDRVVTAAKMADGAALAEIADNDGAGSGLDADLLDGQHAADFAPATHNHDDEYVKQGQPASITDTMIMDGAITDAKLAAIVSTGKVADSALSSNVSLLGQSIESSEILDETITAQDVAANVFWNAIGNAGTLPGTHFLGTSDNQPLEIKVNGKEALRIEPMGTGTPNLIFSGRASFTQASNSFLGSFGGSHSGDGFGLTNLPAASLAGTVPDGRLSANVALLDSSPTFSGSITASAFVGDGAALTSLDASALAIGTLPDARLSGVYTHAVNLNHPDNVISGQFSGDGAGLTNLGGLTVPTNLWQLAGNAGTIPGLNFLGTLDHQPLEIRVNNQKALRIEPNGQETPNWIAGSVANQVDPGVLGATIGGGGSWNAGTPPLPNHVSANYGSIGGGLDNRISNQAESAIIGGGTANRIETQAARATIGGGGTNQIGGDAGGATVGGGMNNVVGDHGIAATISGGQENEIRNGSPHSAIGGGIRNAIHEGSQASTISGGEENEIQGDAGMGTPSHATIGGGAGNRIEAYAMGATIAGGEGNTILANAAYATIPGGQQNRAEGEYSFAAGRHARALHHGAFVWGDSTDADVESTVADQFTIRAANGVRLTENHAPVRPVGIGERYRDNAIIAWGSVLSDGTVAERFGVATVVRTAPGIYQVTLEASAEPESLVPVVTPRMDSMPTGAASARLASVCLNAVNQFTVYVVDGNWNAANSDFLFIVTGR